MKVIESKEITYKEHLSIEKIHRFFVHCKTNLFLVKNGLFTKAETFAAIVSFFLMLKKGDTFLLVLEGEGSDVNQMINSLSNL
jgi:hypothetical protein